MSPKFLEITCRFFYDAFTQTKHHGDFKMSKQTTPQNNSANQTNPNKGTNGTNIAYDRTQGNRGTQLNPNRKK